MEPPHPDDGMPDGTMPDDTMVAHVSMTETMPGRTAGWLGEPGSRLPIEAILLAPAAAGPPRMSPAVESQILYPGGLTTPWTPGGQRCGSAGFALGCLGIRFRLSAATAPFFVCQYDVAFTDGTRLEAVASPTFARSPSGAAVEAVRLSITRRQPVPLVVLNDLGDDPARGERDIAAADPLVRLRLLSPAFATRMPDIRNAALIPAGSWHAMAESFNRRVFASRDVTVRLIEDAIIAGEGVVFDRNLDLARGTDRLMDGAAVERHRQAAQTSQLTGIRRISGMSVLCKTVNPGNYGHFLIEMFPKAWLTARLLSGRPLTHIIHQTDIQQVARDALALIGIDPSAIAVTDHQPVHCDALIVIDGLTAHGVYQSPICAAALTELAQRIPAAPYPKIFVNRDARDRRLHNQAAAEAALRARGFVIVEPGLMTLPEQISLFKGASTVVGPLGAALTNIAFCPSGSKVVALTSQSFPDTFFWFLSQHRGHDYREVRGLDDSGTPGEPGSWNAGFTLSGEDLAFLSTL